MKKHKTPQRTVKSLSKKAVAKTRRQVNKNRRSRLPADQRRVAAALKRYDRAQRSASCRGADLLSVAQSIQQTAVEKRDEGIVRELLRQELPQDIVALLDAFAQAPKGSIPQPFEELRLLPEALIVWLADEFKLEKQGQVGTEMEVPVEKMRAFKHTFETPADPGGIVRVRITSPGWKRNEKWLVPMQVDLAETKQPQV